MGDRHFCLGNVLTDTYYDIFAGNKLQELTKRSCVEVTPPCSWCVYQAYCGSDPIRNYLESGKELRIMENTPFCIKHRYIFDGIFKRLYYANNETKDILWSWITHNPGLVQRHDMY